MFGRMLCAQADGEGMDALPSEEAGTAESPGASSKAKGQRKASLLCPGAATLFSCP